MCPLNMWKTHVFLLRTEISYKPICRKFHTTHIYKIDMSLSIWEKHVVLITYAFLIVLIKKTCDSHIFQGHMSVLYVGYIKFSTNWFVGNFCPKKN